MRFSDGLLREVASFVTSRSALCCLVMARAFDQGLMIIHVRLPVSEDELPDQRTLTDTGLTPEQDGLPPGRLDPGRQISHQLEFSIPLQGHEPQPAGRHSQRHTSSGLKRLDTVGTVARRPTRSVALEGCPRLRPPASRDPGDSMVAVACESIASRSG